MGIVTTTDRVGVALGAAQRRVIDDNRLPTGRWPDGPERLAFEAGVDTLAGAVLRFLSVGDAEDVSLGELENAAGVFCRTHCRVSQEHGQGEHLSCRACPLKPYTVDRVLGRAAELAKEAVRGGDGQ